MPRKTRKTQPKKVFQRKTLFIALVVLFLLCSAALFKNIHQSRQINTEISELQTEVDYLKKNNLEMQQLIEYFNSNAFIEEKARVDLGLKKPGETVVVIPEMGGAANTALPKAGAKESEVIQEQTNYQKWWLYLFK